MFCYILFIFLLIFLLFYNCMYIYTTFQKFGVGKIFLIFLISGKKIRLHLFD